MWAVWSCNHSWCKSRTVFNTVKVVEYTFGGWSIVFSRFSKIKVFYTVFKLSCFFWNHKKRVQWFQWHVFSLFGVVSVLVVKVTKFSGQRLSTLMDGLLGELHLWGKTTTSSSEVLPKTPAKKRFQGKEVDGSMCVFTIDISSNVCWCFPHNIDVGSKKSLPLKRMGFFSAWKRFSKGPEKLTYRTWNTAVSKMSFAFFFWNASLCVLS